MASFPIEARGQRHQRLCGRAAAQTKSQIFNRCNLPCVFTIISFCSPPHSARWCKSILRQSWPWSRRCPQASLRRSFTDVVWHARRREKQLETFAPRSRTRPSGHCAAMRRSTRCDSSHAQERASDRSRLRPDKSWVAAAGRIEQKGGLETPMARYFGTELNDQSLTPGGNPRLGSIRFEEWLGRTSAQR